MAYEAHCNNCGHYEVTHYEGPDETTVREGYSHSLHTCPGFEYPPKDLERVRQAWDDDPSPLCVRP